MLPNDYVRRFVPEHSTSPEIEIETLIYLDHVTMELIQYDMFNDGAKPNVVIVKGPQIEQLYQTLGSLLKELKYATKKENEED